ncbi:MAG: hypothetical protein CVU61_12105 [Deltaproteobacteria bacterium HGW-Deltaproteobacteria-19]|jgi:hypothetical protein|nr:MAG: hypothetical protein CVU61_12105 [Deltaproteobacteria bacterium HGW-Deltaproteobacteria-19]
MEALHHRHEQEIPACTADAFFKAPWASRGNGSAFMGSFDIDDYAGKKEKEMICFSTSKKRSPVVQNLFFLNR